ncbi:hypothetical protein DPMN_069226 [Dreissena polymorpha]|uniref:Uncharacterized protein n=1 Tax=Dreissena polymorpha TaxID=45954 RepID=A0A9D3YZ19_DREPO|nr:hypothetical protein DPMN_069217 [Dreissena polymorpha]KAH3709761.1 hypothetical protein DPMN_069225 [Dreissena polymorpha]KAH3709762.1 hypothetical protein DPMN_069226 [Dreissena polymorpha]
MVGRAVHKYKDARRLTAGSAKNAFPSTADNEAISFPAQVLGTTSPYPTVHSVT